MRYPSSFAIIWRVTGAGLLLLVSVACIDTRDSGLSDTLTRSINATLNAESFRFRISVHKVAHEPRTVIVGTFAQPDRVQWGEGSEGKDVKQIAADGFVFTKIEGRNYWRATEGRGALMWDPIALIGDLLEARDAVELGVDGSRPDLRGFKGVIPHELYPDLLVEFWINSETNLLERILIGSNEDGIQDEAVPYPLEFDVGDYGVETTIDVPSRLLGGGVRVDGRMVLQELTSDEPHKLWRFCIEVGNTGYAESPTLDVEIVSGSSNSVPSGIILYSLPHSPTIPAAGSYAYVRTVSEVELRGPIEGTRVRASWIDQFGEYNHTLLLSKEYSDEPIGLSKDGRTCVH